MADPLDPNIALFVLVQDPFVLELIFQSFHQSAIRGIDIAVQKPLFVSSGDDQTVRLWNYETMNVEQIRAFLEPVYSIGLHPSGHQIVVAFASKVSLMNILIDGFYVVKEYPIHAAHDVRFSHGGHLFAVIDANIIQLISPIYQRVLHRLNHGQTVGRDTMVSPQCLSLLPR
jgi:WD40 repeat protein